VAYYEAIFTAIETISSSSEQLSFGKAALSHMKDAKVAPTVEMFNSIINAAKQPENVRDIILVCLYSCIL
jgi:hypothetical protein